MGQSLHAGFLVVSALHCVVNDDYCDCGWDEPGTSACSGTSETLYLCTNPGAVASYIAPSRVNDGVCDCCDGADEAGGCVSRCGETRDALERKWRRWSGEGVNTTLPTMESMQRQFDAEVALVSKNKTEWKDRKKFAALKKKFGSLWNRHVVEVQHPATPPSVEIHVLICFPLMQPTYLLPVGPAMAKTVCSVLCRDAINLPPAPAAPGGPEYPPMCVYQVGEKQVPLAIDPVDDYERSLLEASVYFLSQKKGGKKERDFFEQRNALAVSSFRARQEDDVGQYARDKAAAFRRMSNMEFFKDQVHSLFDLCLQLEQLEFSWSTANAEQWRMVRYEICFFARASMIDLENPEARRIVIGTATGVLTFRDGDLCGEMGARRLDVNLSCGASKLHEVRNVDKCVYEAFATHPSACRPLGPFTGWHGPPLLPGEEPTSAMAAESKEWAMREFFRLHWDTLLACIHAAVSYCYPPLLDWSAVLVPDLAPIVDWLLSDTIWPSYLVLVRDFELHYPEHVRKLPQTQTDLFVAGCLVALLCSYWRDR